MILASKHMKEQLKSIGYTFLAGFLVEVYPLINDATLENLTKAFLIGLVFAGVRAGIKAGIELLIVKETQ